MPILYRKTAKGLTEIETREHRLTPRARSALILVDGKRDLDALKGLIAQQAEETLAMLLEQGFIAVADRQAAAGPVDIPLDAAPAAKAPPKTVVSAPVADFDATRRAAVRELNNILGPSGESLAIRMERARDAAELRPLLQLAVQVIGNARGKAAAEAYADRHAL